MNPTPPTPETVRKTSLMFSGGVDSTTAALMLAEQYDQVHLLTWGNGYGHYRLERTRQRVEELRRHCGDRFVHTVESIEPLFAAILPAPEREFARFGSGFIWCLGCKIAMHTRTVMYNLAHGITESADGSSRSTGEMVEQMLLSLFMIREFYARFGIRYRTPVYTLPREEEIAFLQDKGFRMGWRIGSRFLGIQPKCRPGELYYLPFLLLNQPPKHDEERVAQFIEEKTALAHELVNAWCAERGIARPHPPGPGEAGDGML